MKTKKKIITNVIALTLIANACAIFAACEGSPVAEQRMSDPNGVWECQYVLYSKTECELGDWLYEYRQAHEYPEYIFFPSHIGEVKVVQLGYTTMMSSTTYHGKGKLFVPYTIEKLGFYIGGVRRTYMICTDKISRISSAICYVPELYYDDYCNKIPENKESFFRANVVYDINYENDEYKYHCVDNYDYTTESTVSRITIIPPIPQRNGYAFGGWYKESECVNQWDFNEDSLPELKLDENGETIFQETVLYAKWIEKEISNEKN